jgi:hypothetical protein
MEIPTKDIIQRIQASIDFGTSLTVGGRNEAIATINAQALEIRELQAVIVRLRGEASAKRRMSDFRSLSEPRPVWEQFKKTWKDH